ncbi:hypothetical protein D3C79_853940 [compost metagenome]
MGRERQPCAAGDQGRKQLAAHQAERGGVRAPQGCWRTHSGCFLHSLLVLAHLRLRRAPSNTAGVAGAHHQLVPQAALADPGEPGGLEQGRDQLPHAGQRHGAGPCITGHTRQYLRHRPGARHRQPAKPAGNPGGQCPRVRGFLFTGRTIQRFRLCDPLGRTGYADVHLPHARPACHAGGQRLRRRCE